jgi:hypothetical protein
MENKHKSPLQHSDVIIGAKKEPKVIIGVPCMDTMKSTTAHCIGRAIIGDPTVIDFLMMKSCEIVSARTWIVKEAIERGGTHLLFVDSDMEFPQDALLRLMARNKDIVSVNYNRRRFPIESVVTQLPESEKSDTELHRVRVAGTGLMLINLDVFKDGKLKQPWFNFGRKDGELTLGEDAWFCLSAQDAGYDVWVDPTIPVFHLGEFGF